MTERWRRRRRRSRLIGTVLVAAAAVVGAWSLAEIASAAPGGKVYVVQAIAGPAVQVSIDGSAVRSGVKAGTVIGPLSLAAGRHVIEVSSGSAAVVSARFSITAGDSLDVVAHRAADSAMSPVVTVFKNDLDPVGPGKTRLVVSHVAVAEPADIRVDGKPFFRNVANGESLSLVVPARSYSLDVVATAGGRTILAPVRATLKAGTLTRVFAFGNPEEKTSDAIVQVLKVPVVGPGAPAFVHTGDGGQAADEYVSTPWTARPGTLAAVAGLLVLAALAGIAGGSVRSLQATGGRPGR